MNTLALNAALGLLSVLQVMGQSPIILPFEMAGQLIVIQAEVDGVSGNFILDTGVDYLLLNERFFKGESYSGSFRHLFGESVVKTRSSEVKIDGFRIAPVQSLILDLSAIERDKDIILHGLLGTHLLRKFEVLVNRVDQEVILFPVNHKGSASHQYSLPPDDTLSFGLNGHLPVLPVTIGGKHLWFGMDTGAEIGMVCRRNSKKLFDGLEMQEQVIQIVSFDGKYIPRPLYHFHSVEIDGWDCPDLKAVLVSLKEYNERLRGRWIDGIIGLSVFGSRSFAINLKKRHIYLWETRLRKETPLAKIFFRQVPLSRSAKDY